MLNSAEVTIVRVPLGSELGRFGVEIMNDFGDKRIMQESLDIFRQGYRFLDPITSPTIMFVAISNGKVVGMTAGVIQDNYMHNSITVVDIEHRRRGIATKLVKHKAESIRQFWPSTNIISRVAQDNIGSIQSLLGAGFEVIKEGQFERKDGSIAFYFIFSYP